MGHDHPQDRQTFERCGEDLFPLGSRLGAVDAAIDDGPSLATVQFVTQQPEIDMVERKRQRHPDPTHAWHDLQGLAPLGHGVAHRVMQLAFEFVHAMTSVHLTFT